MSILKGKHKEIETDDLRLRVVEEKCTQERADFLKRLLEHNGYEAHIIEIPSKVEEEPSTLTIGVTKITFSAVVAVYQRVLKTFDGRKVTPDYWNQKTDNLEPNYWDLSKK